MTDEEWAKLIGWLQSKKFRLVIPIKGKPYLTDRQDRYVKDF